MLKTTITARIEVESGNTTFRKVVHLEAPSISAASIISFGILFSKEADGSVRIGSILKIASWPDSLTLYDSKDALAAEGLYYASWTSGVSSKYTNEDGVEVDLYPAQVTLLGAERKDSESAQNEIAIWKSASGDNYAVSDTRTETIAGQEYEIITYTMKNPDSPWSGGVSAFGVHGRSAVCVEVTCQSFFSGDPSELLEDLLECVSYLS